MQNVSYSSLVSTTGLKGAFTNITDIINTLLPFIFYGAGIAVLIYLIIGGLQMMLSQGDPKAMESAKGKITGALVGFVIIFISYWLVLIIGKLLGISNFGAIFK